MTWPGVPESESPRSGDFKLPATSVGISALALLLMQAVVVPQRGGVIDLKLFMVGAVLVVVPFGIAAGLLYHCNGWINDGSRRCRQTRKGIMSRCQHHQQQVITLYDVAGALAGLAGLLNAWVGLHVLADSQIAIFSDLVSAQY